MPNLAIIRRVTDLRARIADFRNKSGTIGLVPTMGALHEGHLALIDRAKLDNSYVVATIFVNPTQFSVHEDLAAYPRDEARDVEQLDKAGCDLLFAPDVAEMYPQGFATSITVSDVTQHLDGAARPGHFTGVATIVTKLLLQSQPDRAYFGEKDFQQLQMIRRLSYDLNIPVEIIGVPTMREPDGLAMSSRNRYLSSAERHKARLLPQILQETAAQLTLGARAEAFLTTARAQLLAAGFSQVDYVELCDEITLKPLVWVETGSRLFVAAHIGRTRLIDNWPVC